MIHEFWLRELDIQGSYERFEVPPEQFSKFVARIGHDGLVGSSVTVPHKESAFAACDRPTAIAATLGAVNTLWRENGFLCGDNTDVEGFLSNMDQAAGGWAEGARTAVIIGAGGAARAVVNALKSRGFQRIAIVNRTLGRAIALAERSGPSAVAFPWDALASELSRADLLVNASSLGMDGQPILKVDIETLPNHAVVTDIVYVPLRTPLLKAAGARGLRTADGLGMLLYQAVPAFARWFGIRPAVTPALRAMVEADVAVTS